MILWVALATLYAKASHGIFMLNKVLYFICRYEALAFRNVSAYKSLLFGSAPVRLAFEEILRRHRLKGSGRRVKAPVRLAFEEILRRD